MAIEMRRTECAVNAAIGKPLAWAICGLLFAVRLGFRRLAGSATWVRQRYAASRNSA
jgi:hypothetical protein